MSLSDLFKKKPQEEQTPQAPGNPTTMILFRLLAIGYVLWILKDLAQAYLAGGEEAPTLLVLLVAVFLLGGGCIFVAVMTIKQYKQMKTRFDAYNEQVAAEYAAEEAARLAQAEQEDPADDEEILEQPEEEKE